MKNKYFLYLIFIYFLSSCGLQLPFSNVHSGYDDFKNEKINYYQYSGHARPLLIKNGSYPVSIDFKHIEGVKYTKNKMVLFLNLNPERFISDSIFVKINEQIFPLKTQKLLKTPIKESETEVKTEVKKPSKKDKKNSEKETSVLTTQTTNTYEFMHTSLFFELPDNIIKALKNSDIFALRFYVDDQPYTVKIRRKKLDKVKNVFTLDTTAKSQ